MFGFLKLSRDHPRLTQLRGLGLFALLSPRELRVVDGLLHERRYLTGEVIFDEGEVGEALYVILQGRVSILRAGAPNDGRIAEIPQGAMFGELALLDGDPRTAQARALDDACSPRSRAQTSTSSSTPTAPSPPASRFSLPATSGRSSSQRTLRRRRDPCEARVVMNAGHFLGGPLVWLMTMAITTLLLIASSHALWLVVPLLVAILLYYMLFPVVRRLALGGLGRETSAAIVSGIALVAVIGILWPLLPWLAAQSVGGEVTFANISRTVAPSRTARSRHSRRSSTSSRDCISTKR